MRYPGKTEGVNLGTKTIGGAILLRIPWLVRANKKNGVRMNSWEGCSWSGNSTGGNVMLINSILTLIHNEVSVWTNAAREDLAKLFGLI